MGGMQLLYVAKSIWLLALLCLGIVACGTDPSQTYIADLKPASSAVATQISGAAPRTISPTVTPGLGTALATTPVATPAMTHAGTPIPAATPSVVIPFPSATSTPVLGPTETGDSQFGLVVTRGGNALGRVVSSPIGIDCGLSCSALFPAGTAVTLTAVPEEGSVFTGWVGGCAGTGACAVTLTVNRYVTAVFSTAPTPTPTVAIRHTLAISKGGAGAGAVTSSPGGINCGAACSATYPANSSVSLTAIPAPGSVFAGWLGNCSGTAPSCSVTMTMNHAVSAVFAVSPSPTPSTLPQYVLGVSKGGNGEGTVMSAPGGISCGNQCGMAFPSGTTVTLRVEAAIGSVFAGWQGDCSGTGSCTLTMTVNHAVSATFTLTATSTPAPSGTQALGSLAVQKGGSGFGKVISAPAGIDCGSTCTGTFAKGTVVTLTATPLSGSVFVGWLGDCAGAGACTVTVKDYSSVAAVFDQT